MDRERSCKLTLEVEANLFEYPLKTSVLIIASSRFVLIHLDNSLSANFLKTQ